VFDSSVGSTCTGSSSDDEKSDCDKLPADYPLRAKLNGTRLPLDYADLPNDMPISDCKAIPLKHGRLLVGLHGALYLLNPQMRVEWKYEASWILWDFAVVESTELVYGSAGDGIMFILDATSGKELIKHAYNGRFNFGQVLLYGNDQCLMVGSMRGYRDSLDEWKRGNLEMDTVTAWRGTEELWHADIPPDAELVVKDGSILAITKTKTAIYFSTLEIPSRGGNSDPK